MGPKSLTEGLLTCSRDKLGSIVEPFGRVGDSEEAPETGNVQMSISSIKPIEKQNIFMWEDWPSCQESLRSTARRGQDRPKWAGEGAR